MITRSNAVIPITPAADLTGKEGYFITAAGALAGANVAAHGVITEGAPVSGKASVAICAGGYAGTVSIKLGANATAGAFVGSNAAGEAIPTATTKCAQILEAGTTGELVEGVIFKGI